MIRFPFKRREKIHKSDKDIEIMAEGGEILAEILRKISLSIKPGITAYDLEKLSHELVSFYKVEPAFKNYEGYPYYLCTSINNEVVHGIPSPDKRLKEGDVVNIDFGIKHKGLITDSAVTVLIPSGKRGDQFKEKLINVTKKSLEIGISQAIIGNTTGDIGSAIQKYVESQGFNVVRELVGHGVGKFLHEFPEVPNYGKSGYGNLLEKNMVIAIEPMVVTGSWDVKDGKDGYSFETTDGGLAAHFEHTVAITEKGPLILTQ